MPINRRSLMMSAMTLGAMRNGPDLSNVGAPKGDDSKRKYVSDPQWLYLHLYNPHTAVEGSVMPAYRYLFSKHKITGEPSPDALPLTGKDAPARGYEIVPSSQAKALVAYLLSLDKSHPLKEPKGSAPAAK